MGPPLFEKPQLIVKEESLSCICVQSTVCLCWTKKISWGYHSTSLFLSIWHSKNCSLHYFLQWLACYVMFVYFLALKFALCICVVSSAKSTEHKLFPVQCHSAARRIKWITSKSVDVFKVKLKGEKKAELSGNQCVKWFLSVVYGNFAWKIIWRQQETYADLETCSPWLHSPPC